MSDANVDNMVFIEELLTEYECEELMNKAKILLSEYEDGTGLDRIRAKESHLAATVDEKLRDKIETIPWIPSDRFGETFTHCQFFFTRYLNGGQIGPHIDGNRTAGEHQSVATILLYLNEDFQGGETCSATWKVKPVAGSALILKQDVKHWGLPVKNGAKYIMRSDIML